MADTTETIIVTRTLDGLVRIGPTPPPGQPLDFATIDTYQMTGLHSLIEGQQLAPVIDFNKWLAERERIGFRFQKTNSETVPPKSDFANRLDPRRSYTAQEIAELVNNSSAVVHQWWDNWHNGKEPRLNSRLETGKGPSRVSTAYDLLVLHFHYGVCLP